jgi:hypothetical protein
LPIGFKKHQILETKSTHSYLSRNYIQWRNQEIFLRGGGISTNSVKDRGAESTGIWDGSPLVRGSAQFENE